MTKPIEKEHKVNSLSRYDRTNSERAEKLLTVALELFSKSDFSTVSIKKIADKAGVNSALIYYYFDSKEALFQAALERAVLQVLENYATLQKQHNNPVDLINNWFDTHVDFAEPIERLVKILIDYSTSGSQINIIDNIIHQFYEEEGLLLSSSIEWGIKLDLFNSVDSIRLARFASTFLDGVMARAVIMPTLDVADVINDFKEVFWNYLGYNPATKSKKRLD